MSLAIALDNSPETISNLENLKIILKFLDNMIPQNAQAFINEDHTITREMLEDISEWIDDLHKILTSYEMFSNETSQ